MYVTLLLPYYLLSSLLVGLVQGDGPCNTTFQNTIQLNNGGVFVTGQSAGRVELCYCSELSCSWQTVSAGSLTVPFSWKNSIVVCRELEYFDVRSPILQNTVLEANHADGSVSIYPTTFVCDGTESSLADCTTGVTTASLTHESDAYVTCQTYRVYKKVRLAGTTIENEGVVELYTTNNEWGTICPDFWDDPEADILCKSLGFSSGSAIKYSKSLFDSDAEINSDTRIGSVTCTGASTISSCSVSLSPNCADFANLAGAICVSQSGITEGSVRETNTGDTYYSLVEVFYAGRWGTVCNTAWQLESAQVACRELGETPSLTEIPYYGFTGNSLSSQPIWIVGYNCEGSESSLTRCSRPLYPIGFAVPGCTHDNDAGLYCDTSPAPPFSGAEIFGFVVLAFVAAGLIILFIVLLDTKKREQLLTWIRSRRDIFLRWCTRQQQRLRSCCRRQRRQRVPQASQPVVLVSQSTPAPVVIPAPTTPAPQPTTPPNVPDQGLTPSAPPSYDEALVHQHVPPPPDYSPGADKQLPYPEKGLQNPAYPPSAW